ncbi:DUF2946 domain-containing protein [Komagataeibacter sp. FNDCF1]|uniref:DUF2946 domain-containing protein n=1 Tax=Komagataeibacter sp. FNDCF1 TaxID=2878681 RepID=UPI001E5DC0B6|nr:DUF2946 domain-containing protein [Komagataeibacter sp. FNDCF1]MCE2564147.1 DUF2946 domain-containing protein [Komagataeibacter sp. FNDCF1]
MGHARHPFMQDMPVIRWVMVLCACMGLWGQLLIESRSLPGELPRSTIMRLTGIDIAPPVTHTASMPAMDPAHHATMKRMTSHLHAAMPHAGHDHGEGCPLCPLLHLPALALAIVPFMPLPPMAWAQARHEPRQPRAPPSAPLGLPPSRGPPSIS